MQIKISSDVYAFDQLVLYDAYESISCFYSGKLDHHPLKT